MNIGDLVRGSKTNITAQQNSVAMIVDRADDGTFSIRWLGGEIKSNKICDNFEAIELEVISEGR